MLKIFSLSLFLAACAVSNNTLLDETHTNDYAKASTIKLTPEQIKAKVNEILIAEPTERDPVSVATQLLPAKARPGEVMTLAIKVHIKPGWHIYSYVPPTAAYIKARLILELPEGLQQVGDWEKPSPEYFPGESNILIYQGELLFLQKILVAANYSGDKTVTLKAGLDYQTCNKNVCLRPKKKTTDLKIMIE